MSTDKIRLPGVSDDEDRLLNRLLKQLSDKSSRNVLRASYYDGKRAIQQVGTVIPPQYTRLGIVLGWSAKAVDILARRCNLDGFVWADGDLDSLGAQEVWDDNHLGAEINSLLVSSLIHSTAFLVNTEGGDNEPASLISVKDALNATGDWNVRARRLDNLLSITAREENQPTGLALYLDGETLTATKENGKWTVERQFHPWGVPAEAVAYKPRVGRPFGSSRISRPVMSIHDQALRTIIRLEGHADVFSYPEMWMLGADPSIFRNADGTVQPQWQVMLGRIKASRTTTKPKTRAPTSSSSKLPRRRRTSRP
ncbi:Phage portal protein, SPP1 Gp6-like [Mycolicibacterium conceptionense]|uniref:Phage portal protein, SPP1 Gp6-like n=1 Tax=Mycolicibacterium conceptionense TaxID=451644 RepID=A0A0U1D5K4_9MYCO|nr:Phage portal protein, SPP1 Gp6-like [Mycolicibacterium conceptionense]